MKLATTLVLVAVAWSAEPERKWGNRAGALQLSAASDKMFATWLASQFWSIYGYGTRPQDELGCSLSGQTFFSSLTWCWEVPQSVRR